MIQLSTATPKEAATSNKWFNDQGAFYLDGAILCWPSNIGTPSGQIAIAGPESVFADCQINLQHLAGDLRYLGTNIRAPATIDLAFLSRTVGVPIQATQLFLNAINFVPAQRNAAAILLSMLST